jgi:hypothetical protein
MNQPGMITAGQQNLTNPLLLAKVVFPDELDLKACLGGQPLGVFPDLVAQEGDAGRG